jgi:hypothetical protein
MQGAAIERMDLRLVLLAELELALGWVVDVDEFGHRESPPNISVTYDRSRVPVKSRQTPLRE